MSDLHGSIFDAIDCGGFNNIGILMTGPNKTDLC
jgi:hypothetical protein